MHLTTCICLFNVLSYEKCIVKKCWGVIQHVCGDILLFMDSDMIRWQRSSVTYLGYQHSSFSETRASTLLMTALMRYPVTYSKEMGTQLLNVIPGTERKNLKCAPPRVYWPPCVRRAKDSSPSSRVFVVIPSRPIWTQVTPNLLTSLIFLVSSSKKTISE